jgi:pyrrolysine biosynthesis protein PylC
VKLLIVGGKLQGTEAAYLAAKAGWETVLVDRREAPPAAGLVGRHVVADITADVALSRALARSCDAVLPASEDLATLTWLSAHVPEWGVPLLFDLDSYRTTESKLASRRLFVELDVPRPAAWPECGFPAVVKPSRASGSEGVAVVDDEHELAAAQARLKCQGHEVVVEEYVAGPSLSLEVLAWGGRAVPLQATGLEFDADHDCKRVVAPVGEAAVGGAETAGRDGSCAWRAAVAPGTLAALNAVGVRLAEGLGLRGLMDVEVMVCGTEPNVLEIDARLPSQTPTAVYWSSGLNMLELLAQTVLEGAPPDVACAPRAACVYQHLGARGSTLSVLGEHVMGSAAPLQLVPGFFGADEALTDYRPGAASWAATLIARGATVAEARGKAARAAGRLAEEEHLELLPEGDARRDEEAKRR